MTDPRQPAEPGTMSTAQAAALLDLTERRVQQLAREGVIPKASYGRYPVAGTVRGYIGYLRDEVRRSTETAAGAALKATRQAEIELRMAERQRDLVPADEMMAVTQMIVGTLVSRLTGLPAQFTRNLGERHRLETLIDAIRIEVAELIEQHQDAYERIGAEADHGSQP